MCRITARDRRTEARADVRTAVGERERLVDHRVHTLGDGEQRLVPHGSPQRMVNSSPPKRATESDGRERQPVADGREHLVAGGVAVGVVDPLEVVEVAEDHTDACPALRRELERDPEPVEEEPCGWGDPVIGSWIAWCAIAARSPCAR